MQDGSAFRAGNSIRPAAARRQAVALLAMLLLVAGASFAKSRAETGWVQTKGKGYTLCDGLLKQLRRYRYPDPLKQPNACSWAVVANYPGLSEPPWEDIDAAAHEEMLFEFYRMQSIGTRNYAAGIRDRTDFGNIPTAERYIREQVGWFYDGGGSMQLWRMPLPDRYLLLKKSQLTSGPLYLVNLRKPVPDGPRGLGACPQVPKVKWRSNIMLANSTLTGPDLRQGINDGAPLLNLNGNALWFYGKALHRFVVRSSAISIFRDDIPPSDWAGDFCRLDYFHPR